MDDKVQKALEARKKRKEAEEQKIIDSYERSKTKVDNALAARAKRNSQGVDDTFINTFLSDANSFLSSAKDEYGKVGWGNASSSYESRYNTWKDLDSRHTAIRGWLMTNKNKLDEETYKGLSDTLDSYRDSASSIINAFEEAKNHYSKWETEEEYNSDVAAWQNYYDKWGRYADKEDFGKVSANRTFANPTDEDLSYYDAMMDYNSWRTGADGQMYDAFGNHIPYVADDKGNIIHPMQNDEKYAINDPLGMFLSMSEDERSELLYGGEQTGRKFETLREGITNHWEQLSEDETSMYYYLMNTQGKDVAVEYLRDTAEKLNARWGSLKAQEIESIDNDFERVVIKGLFGLHAGVDQWGTGVAQFLNGEASPTSGMQYANAEILNSLDGLGKYAYQATNTVGNMLPSIFISRGLGMAGLGANAVKGVGAFTMGSSAGGNAYGQALKEGYSEGQARTYGTLVGASEGLLEYLIGGISDLGGVGTGKILSKLSAIDNALLRVPAKLGVNIGSEIFEEELQNYLEPAFRSIIFGEDYDAPTIEEFIETAIVTAMSTGLLEGGNTIATDVAETRHLTNTGRTIMAAEGGVDALKNLANEVAGVSTEKMQNTINKQAGKVSSETATGKGLGKIGAAMKNTSNATKVGRLYNTVQTANNLANTSANKADIAKSLERKGFTAETANDIAEALVASYNGQELTKAQEKLLKSAKENSVVQDAISNIVTNERSTMGQRSQNIRSFERGIAEGVLSKAITEAAVNNTTEKQFTPSGDYAVSKDGKATALVTEDVEGKTITNDTGEIIDIKGVASIRKGEMLLDIGDGKTINAKNVAYANKNDALIYESIANLGDNINAETANKLIGKYKGGDALVFARGIAQAYTYGFYGIDRSELTGKRSLTTELTEEQRNFAYGLGERYRPIKDANDKTEASKKLAKSGKTPSEKGVYYRDKDGNATDISAYLKESNIKLNDLQKTGIEAMRKMSKMMGVRFNIFESWVENGKSYYLDQDGEVVEGNSNGFYDTTTGEIYIDLNAGNDYQGTMLFTIAHEVTHFMRQWSPEHFTKIAKIVFQHGGMKGNVSELVALKQARAKAKGKPISYDVAMEEVVADGMETILKDGKVVEFMADVKKKDYAAWEKLKGWFKNLAKFLRKMVWAYSSQSAQTTEGAKVAEFSQDILSQIERIFAEGAVASGENYSRVESIVGQINIFLDEIMALDTVDTIDSSNATPYTGIRKVDEISGRDVFKAQGGVAIRPGFGRVHIGKKGAVNTVFHGNGPAKQAAFPAIKAVIENGIEIARDYNHDGLGFDTITFSAPIKFFGNKSPLAVVVKVFESVNADKTFYIHEICDAQGNYIQMDGTEFEQKNSSTNLVEPTSTVSAAYDGSNPNTSIHNDGEIVKSESAEAMDVEVDTKTESVAPSVLKSERTWTESDYVQERDKAAKEIAKAIGVSEKKAKAYIDSVNSIAKMIAEDRVRLDYFSSPGRSSFVGNVEYGGSFDFSTLCKKRRLLTGTFTAIQKALPNTALTADEILKIRNRMKDAGLEVSCGLCYVEGSRANMGQFAKEFLNLYKQYYPDAWQPNMADVNTPDGIEWVRINHPECYEQYEYFWNHYGTLKPGDKNLFASQQKPKLYQLHTEYNGEILDKFKDDDNVEEKNLNGGIRLQSFSDFEIVHLIDTMQIIMDMSRVGLAGQAYTKVPDFAWALGDTGLKINLSLIAKGVDENGNLIFDDVEGMPIAEAMKLRDRYSKNVGTILVAFNDEQLMAAMADDRVDFIIPFHRSQWKKSQYEAMGLPAKTKDYTYMQNEKFIKPQYHEYRGIMVKDKATNYMPNEYWDFSKSGKENAEAYLEMCARNNKRPKFYKLLHNNGDGSYSLKADGSTDGYWKLLIDFKMYDNDGNGSPQMPVKPEFNMDEAQRMLNDYQGGHSNFPVAQGIVDSFVEEYKDSHKGEKFSVRDSDYLDAVNRGDTETAQKMVDDVRYQDRADESVSNRSLLANAFEGLAQNDIEKNKIQEYKGKVALINEEERKLAELNAQIKELSFSKGPRDTKKIKSLRFDAVQAANRINTYDKQLLRLEASKPLQDVLAREKKLAYEKAEKKGKEALDKYKERADKTQRELLEKWQESRKKGIDSRYRTAMRHKIKDVVNELNQYLLKGTKDRHVPESLQKAVAEALNAVNMDTVGAEERIAKLKAEMMKAKTPEQIQEISRKIDNISEMGDRMNGKLKKLKDAYEDLLKSTDENTRTSYDEVIYNKMDSVIDKIGNTPLRDMTLAQLEDVYDMYRMVLTTIRNANKAFKAKKSESISVIANQVMMEVEEVGGKNKYNIKGLKGIKRLDWNNLKPVYAFERIGSDTLTEVYNNVRTGEDVWAMDTTEAKRFRLEQEKKYGFDSWDFDKTYRFKSASGLDFDLNIGQIMSLYAFSKREQAGDHLSYGGFVFDGITEVKKRTKAGITITYELNDATSYNLSTKTLADIVSKLSNEQKSFVDEMQEYLSSVMGEKGNEVSLELYGIKLFKEKFYFPLRSSQQYLARAKEQAQGDIKIKNSGFSKETAPKAKNPIVLSSFMDVWADHVNEMSMYHAFVLPMEDFYRVYNYTTPSSDPNLPMEGVVPFIQNAYTTAATGYIDQLLKDLNGGAIADPRETFAKAMMAKFKKAKVFTSLSVVIQQPSAIGRAFALVDPKYFRPTKDGMNHKELWNELKTYAPVAIIKEMGYFDTNMGRSAKEYILSNEYSGLKEKSTAFFKDSDYRDELLSKLPAWADESTWCAIWNAVKRETVHTHKDLRPGSGEFLKAAGNRFTEVVTKTQVYDSVLARSANMRSKSGLMSMATSFMAEPTTTINMLEDAIIQGNRGNKKYAARAFASVMTAIILNNVLVSLVYAGRDDDEDETFLEKYMQSFVSGMLDDVNPITYYPFLKDMWSVLQGYDVERTDVSLFSELADSMKDIVKAYNTENGDVAGAWWDIAGSASNLRGIPMQNIRREISAAVNFYKTLSKDFGGRATTKRSMGDALEASIRDTLPIIGWLPGDTKADNLYDAIIRGDTVYVDRLKSSYKTKDSYHSAVRKALRENDPRIKEAAVAGFNGDPSERVRIAKLIVADGFDQDDVVAAINAEVNEMEPDEPKGDSKKKGYYTAEDFATEIANGDQASANAAKDDIIQTAVKNGKTQKEAEEEFASSAKTAFRKMFVAGTLDESKAAEVLKTYCPKKDGPMDDEDIYWTLREWKYEKSTGSSDGYGKYNDFHTAVQTGKNLKAVIKEYTDHGVEKKTLASQITSYFKPLYKEMSKAERAGIKGYLLNAYSLLGYNRNEKAKDIDAWLKD